MPLPRALVALPAAALVVAALAGCTQKAATTGAGSNAVTVTATDTACSLSTSSIRSGTTTFTVTNTGTKVTEFYVSKGETTLGEVENVAPGLSRSLSVSLQPGNYTTLCKPGETGSGVGKATLTVSGDSAEPAADVRPKQTAIETAYRDYVRAEATTLLADTKRFAALYAKGSDAAAKALYPTARASYERIEPVAESFGSLDPELDARKPDVPAGTAWTGWHRIEADLWGTAKPTAAERRGRAATLVEDTESLVQKVDADGFRPTADAISNGAIAKLDEVAKSKITGEEEAYSHTDLADFAANLEGARKAYDVVRPLAAASEPALVRQIDARYATLATMLAKHRSGDGYVPYTTLADGEVKALSDGVNALAEPLSRLTAAVLG
jgi:iron uptake system component EfeO